MSWVRRTSLTVLVLLVLERCSADAVIVDEVVVDEVIVDEVIVDEVIVDEGGGGAVQGTSTEEYDYAKQLEVASLQHSNMTEQDMWRAYRRIVKDNKESVKATGRVVEKSADAMWGNFVNFFRQAFFQVSMDASEYSPHFAAFFDSIPAEAYHKSALGHLNLALKLNQHNCGRISLKYNPIRPSHAQEDDEGDLKEEVEAGEEEGESPMSLSKFGKVIAKWMTNAESTMVGYISESVPVVCQHVEAWLKQRIAEVEDMKPEDVKKKFKY